MKSYQSRHEKTISNRGFYSILGVCGIIIAVSLFVIFSANNSPDVALEAEADGSVPISSDVDTMPDLSADMPVAAEEAPEEDTAEASAPAEVPQEPVTVSAPVYVRPTSGAIITPFSGDELLFQPTFGDWRVHTGTDFAAETQEPVLAITNGTVESVTNDDMYGITVTLSHDTDLVTTYSGLESVRVSVGQLVDAGETLGLCAESLPAEAAQGTHVHVEAERAGTAIDVVELIGEVQE